MRVPQLVAFFHMSISYHFPSLDLSVWVVLFINFAVFIHKSPLILIRSDRIGPAWLAYVLMLTAAVLNGFLMCPKHGVELVFLVCCQLSHVDPPSCSNLKKNTDSIRHISAEKAPFLLLTEAVYAACCIFIFTSCMFICQVFQQWRERFLHWEAGETHTLPPSGLKMSRFSV